MINIELVKLVKQVRSVPYTYTFDNPLKDNLDNYDEDEAPEETDDKIVRGTGGVAVQQLSPVAYKPAPAKPAAVPAKPAAKPPVKAAAPTKTTGWLSYFTGG
jgi:hypothetical protein